MDQRTKIEFDWDNDIVMPVANKENKLLEEKIRLNEQKNTSLKMHNNEHDDRIRAMEEHMKNVRQEWQQTQAMCRARQNENQSEKHFLQLANREKGRIAIELQRIANLASETKDKMNIYQNVIFKNNQKIDDIKDQVKWDQQALEAWLEECTNKDEDALILQKYTRVDETKVTDLSLKSEKNTEKLSKLKKQLDFEATQTLTSQLEVDKVAEDFRRAHQQRQELLEQWQTTIEQMQRRDKDIEGINNDLAKINIHVREKENSINERLRLLESIKIDNQEVRKKIAVGDQLIGKSRLEYQDVERARNEIVDELESLRLVVDRTANDYENIKSKDSQLKAEIADKQNRLLAIQEERDDLAKELKESNVTTLSVEEKADRWDKIMRAEENRLAKLEQELQQLGELRFKKNEILHKEQHNEMVVNAEIQGSRAAIKNLDSRLAMLDRESLKQQELIYTQDFQLQQLERRIARLQGEVGTDEKEKLTVRAKELTTQCEKEQATKALLTNQMKRLQDDLRRTNRELEKSKKEKDALTTKIGELNLHNDSSQRELRRLTAQKQDTLVEDNLLRLELKKIREHLQSKADDVLTQEKRRLQLETAMKERRHEINIHKDMLRAQLKSASEEKQTISSELHERISKIDKLRRRYELLMVSMAPPEGEEEHTQAYFVIKAAQEKEELQRQGDILDAKIRKAEKEIRALDNTFRLLAGRNEKLRKSLQPVDDMADEVEEKELLEKQLAAVLDKYKYKRRQVREIQEDLQAMRQNLSALDEDENNLLKALEDLQLKGNQLKAAVSEQQKKQERINKQMSKLVKEVRNGTSKSEELPQEKDIDTRLLRDFNNNIMQQVKGLSSDNPNLSTTVSAYYQQAGLSEPPSPASSRQSSRPPSVLSSSRSQSSVASSRNSVVSRTSVASNSKQSIKSKTMEFGATDIGSAAKSPTGSKVSSRASSRTSSKGKKSGSGK
ncbi:Coiled-coil domain-containing protein 39 [Trichoplax sp. H2]|nr:Coiled-coil domain-containing protein 39 [Trichoplax sp. H2]|eukprot:RDD47548.1 Coiled-coil domain-containing protein 39 [Trichoplax sp. H2]